MAKLTASARRRFARVGTGTSVCLRYRLPRAADRLPGAPKLSREAKVRLRYLGYARTHSVAATCDRFGIARSTFYRWKRRYDPRNLATLEDRPSRPRLGRRPTWRRPRRRPSGGRGRRTPAGARTSWRSSCGGRGSASPSPWSVASWPS